MDIALQKKMVQRAKIIRGQLDKLINGIEEDEYCIKLITESLTIQKGLSSLDSLLLENHLTTSVPMQLMDRKTAAKAIAELVQLYKLSNK